MGDGTVFLMAEEKAACIMLVLPDAPLVAEPPDIAKDNGEAEI